LIIWKIILLLLKINFLRSGKGYTLRGFENKERGILIHAVEDLLNLIEI